MTINQTATADMELAVVNPADIVIDTNVRTMVDIDPGFYESIRDHGVRTPPTCWRDADGVVHVECGQRRVLAATQAKLPEIRVLIVPREHAVEEAEAEKTRIVSQLTENDQRQALTDGERVEAWQQLALFGMSADEIAKATKTKRDKVRTAVKIAKDSPATVELIKERQLTIDEALVMQEFQEEPAEVLDNLERTMRENPAGLDRLVSELRRKRELAAQEAACRAEAKAAGVRTWRPSNEIREWSGKHKQLEEVRIGKATEAPTLEEAKAQGGLVASMATHQHWDGTKTVYLHAVKYFIEDPKEHGYRIPRQAHSSPKSDEQRAKELEEKRAKRARRQAWGIATEDRQAWIKDTLLTAKPPAEVLLWLVKYQVDERTFSYADLSWAAKEKQRTLALHWLGEPEETNSYRRRRAGFLKQAAARPGTSELVVMLAHSLAGTEAMISDPKSYNYGEDRSIGGYLRQLQEWGYQLVDVEKDLVKAFEKEEKRILAEAAKEDAKIAAREAARGE